MLLHCFYKLSFLQAKQRSLHTAREWTSRFAIIDTRQITRQLHKTTQLFRFSHNARERTLRTISDAVQHIKANLLKDNKTFSGRVIKWFTSKPRHTSLLLLYAPALLLCSGGAYVVLKNFDSLCLTARCKAKHVYRNRLSHHDDDDDSDSKKPDPEFQWNLFFRLIWTDIFYLLGAILTAIGAAVLNIQIPLMLGDLTNIVTKFTTDTASDVADFMSEIRMPALKLLAVYCLQGLLTFSYISLLTVVGENLANRLRKQLFHSLLKQDIEFFDVHKTGELVDRLTSDVQDFKSSFKITISQGLRATTQIIGCVVSLFLVSAKLTVIMIGVLPVVIIGGSTLGALLRSLSREAQEQISMSTAIADEALGNVRTVRAFAMEHKEFELYEKQVDKSSVMNIKLGTGIGALQGATNVFLNSIVLGSLYAGGWLISRHELKAGDLISFLVATQMVERSMAQLSLLFGHVVSGLSAGARVFEYINLKPKVSLEGGQKIPFHSFFGDIEFSDVSFHYPTRKQSVLSNFSLHIPGGKMVALVGLSGGGKSTLAVLLERFYDATSGKIKIDGIDIQKLDPSWLRGRAIGFINQEPVLFATTVMENIRYGRPGASDQEVIEAAKLANAHQFIESFPNGYKTVLGERGVTVSGGQKQRIAIARALIKNPSILILDEATSALDAESERLVQEALDRVVQGRTTLVIAHRLSTVRDADMIAVISKGRLMELGTHQELKARKGFYWELIQKQELEEDLQKS